MAIISKDWTTSWVAGSDLGSDIPAKGTNLAQSIVERMQNVGAYWPSSHDAKSGLLYPSTNNYVSGEFNIYGETANAPDTTNKIISVTNSAVTLGQTLHPKGTSGLPMIVQGTHYLPDSTGTNVRGNSLYPLSFVVPPDFITATITGFFAFASSLQGTSLGVSILKYSPTWSGDGVTALSGAVLDTFTWAAATEYAHRKTGTSLSVAAGDIIKMGINFNYVTVGYVMGFGLWIERTT